MKPSYAAGQPRYPAIPLVLAGLLVALAGGCASSEAAHDPTLPWNQTFVTQAAASFASEMNHLYSVAYKDPSFSGERAASGSTLDTLRTLEEESAGLRAELAQGEGYAQTLTRYERIKELVRDAQESGAWEFVPADLSAAAQASLATIRHLDGYYGNR